MRDLLSVKNSQLLNELLLSKKYKIIRHAGALTVIALFAFNFISFYRQPYAFWLDSSLFINLVLLYYLNMYWLVPTFLVNEKLLAYLVSVLLYIMLAYTGVTWLHEHFAAYRLWPQVPSIPAKPGLLPFAFTTLIMAAASTAIKLLQQWTRDKEKLHVLQELTIKTELEALRNQISPHFLFNMLNNANLLTYKDPKKASEVLMGLSDILKYQLYDCHMKEVFLRSEIRFMEDFLQLESIRRDGFEFDIDVQGNVNGILVPPMLFVIFLENAVKHSADPGAFSYIYVSFNANDSKLCFRCDNSKPLSLPAKAQTGGIGLTNAKRRLDLLKPGRHDIKVAENEECYSFQLNMEI